MKIKYPKFLAFIVILIIAAIMFYEAETYQPLHAFIISLGYVGTFVCGFFYAYSFTAPPATAILLVLSSSQNLYLAAVIGGIGALISDVLIFRFIRFSFEDEVESLKKEKIVKKITNLLKKIFGKIYEHFITLVAAILIATPLPTEIGVTILASQKNLSEKRFMVIAYFIHTIGIFLVLSIGKII